MKLLLISNSTNPGEDYLGWVKGYISDYMKTCEVKDVLFIPYAGISITYNDYEKRVADVYQEFGCNIRSIHHENDVISAVKNAKSIAVGGGNTFYLVYMLHKMNLMNIIRERVLSGVPYMGWSAGANIACPTLRTTNDMPIIQPESFNCLNLVNFQINPHYLDAHPAGHGGETRQQRIEEFLIANPDVQVAGLRESSLLKIVDSKIELIGKNPMRLFSSKHEPLEYQPGTLIQNL